MLLPCGHDLDTASLLHLSVRFTSSLVKNQGRNSDHFFQRHFRPPCEPLFLKLTVEMTFLTSCELLPCHGTHLPIVDSLGKGTRYQCPIVGQLVTGTWNSVLPWKKFTANQGRIHLC